MSKPEAFDCDVLCVGHASYDIAMQVNKHPAADGKSFATGMVSCGGGPAANAAVTVTKLGGQGAFAGHLGTDTYGDIHLEELNNLGVNTELVVRRPYPTPVSVAFIKPNGDRALVTYNGDTPFLNPKDVDFTLCHPKAILFDGREPLVSLPLALEAKLRGIPTILDAGSVHRGTNELSPVVDYLVSSAKFARDFTGASDPKLALVKLSEISRYVVITLGHEGLLWKRGDDSGSRPAFRIGAVDTTGAGDVFHGAFTLGVTRGMAWEDLLTYASAAAALCCTRIGARVGVPTSKEVDGFLRQHNISMQ